MANTGALSGRVLAIDDDRQLLRNFALCLEQDGHRVTTAATLPEGLRLAATQPFHVCLLDRSIGPDSGLEALPRFHDVAPQMRIVVVTAHTGVDDAVKAISNGACDYLVKPCSPDQLRIAVARQVDTRRLLDKLEHFEREAHATSFRLSSRNAAMNEALRVANQVAATDANVLLLGETGTGKGVLAAAIHAASPRAQAPMATINCPSLGAEGMEAELFGDARGANGGLHNPVGRVTYAEGGTVFLDEIGDFPLSLQPRLLRFIQDRLYERAGDPTTRKADTRIVASTNHDLDAMVAAGTFREDLLYRLNVITIRIPPLRERPEDIADLAQGFVERYAASYRLPARGLSAPALALLRQYRWPGNVRELQNVIERAVILCPNAQVGPEFIAIARPSGEGSGGAVPGAPLSLEELERLHIQSILSTCDTLEAAARTLGIDSSTLYRKRKAYEL
jgi:NtrC-family two-component system response regulator AlgB